MDDTNTAKIRSMELENAASTTVTSEPTKESYRTIDLDEEGKGVVLAFDTLVLTFAWLKKWLFVVHANDFLRNEKIFKVKTSQ